MMKLSIILCLASLFINHPVKAVDTIYQQPAIDTAVIGMYGTWQWVSGTDTLTIHLREEKESTKIANLYAAGQSLFSGWHRFVKKRNLVEGTYSFMDADIRSGKSNHASLFGYLKNKTECTITQFKDFTGDLWLTGSLTLLAGETDRAILQVEPERDLRVVSRNHDYPFQFITIPTNIVLKKMPL